MVLFYVVIVFMIIDLALPKKANRKFFAFILMAIFTFFAMFRAQTVGSDTNLFCSAFFVVNKLTIAECLESRYELLNIILFKIIGYFSTEYQMLIIVSSVLINFGVYKFIVNNSKNPLTSCILFFTLNYYFMFLCLMRQAFALLMILIAYEMLKKNKYVKSLIFIICAALFHTSAIIFVILLPLKMIKKEVNVLGIVLPLSLVGFVFGGSILKIAVNIISDYSKYLESSYIGSSYITAGLYTLTSLVFLIFGLFVPSKSSINKEYSEDQNYNLLKWILSVGTIISAISIKVALFSREYIYFGFFAIIWLSNNLHILHKKGNLLVWKFIIYFFTIVYVFVLAKFDWYGIFPYIFYWE